LSFLGRRYGLAANHVSAIEVVTADGRLVRADRQHEQDLFWALRGGGGSFGVVTAIEFDLFPITGRMPESCGTRSTAARKSCTPGGS
jgi:FAD/FMN-containing dehydrogenase